MARGRPRKKREEAASRPGSGATTGYEAELWAMADALRGAMDAAEYKHVVLGLIFLKYISDAFEERHAALVAERDQGADPEDPDEYRAENIFWVPPEARWKHLQAQAKQPTIGQLVDDAMSGIERDNPALKDVLPKDYARPAPLRYAGPPVWRRNRQCTNIQAGPVDGAGHSFSDSYPATSVFVMPEAGWKPSREERGPPAPG